MLGISNRLQRQSALVVELKALSRLEKIHEVQLVNYLKASAIDIGLLINFGPKIEIKRRIFNQ